MPSISPLDASPPPYYIIIVLPSITNRHNSIAMSSAPRPTIIQTAESILKIERSKWIYHERALTKRLGMSVDHLRGFIQAAKSGGVAPPPYDTAIDLNSGGIIF